MERVGVEGGSIARFVDKNNNLCGMESESDPFIFRGLETIISLVVVLLRASVRNM